MSSSQPPEWHWQRPPQPQPPYPQYSQPLYQPPPYPYAYQPLPQPMPQQVIYVERRGRDHGCLIWTILLTLFLGPFGLLLGASAGLMRGMWRGAEAYTRRYGWRGWAWLGAGIIVLAIISHFVQ